MNNKKVVSTIVLAIFLVSCNKMSSTDVIEYDKQMTLYKYDSLSIDQSSKLTFDNKVFGYNNGKLFLLQPDQVVKRKHILEVNNLSVLLKICDWTESKFIFSTSPYDGRYPLLFQNDTLFFIENNRLKYNINGATTDCAHLALLDPMYNEMVSDKGNYAIRSQGRIMISGDLRTWATIYHDKRAIAKSMAFVVNTIGQTELLFSEYTPGADRIAHNVIRYNLVTRESKRVFTFHKRGEGVPHARHIHILEKDPYTGDIWVGTGDEDDESHIYRSTDNGLTFSVVGTGSQLWRTLAFIFTPDYIFWNVDSHEPQYLTRVARQDLFDGVPVENNKIKRFSIINSACWAISKLKTPQGEDMWIMNSNNEGGLYDSYCRTYGFQINKNGVPLFCELTKISARSVYTQLYMIGVTSNNSILFYDHEAGKYETYKLTR